MNLADFLEETFQLLSEGTLVWSGIDFLEGGTWTRPEIQDIYGTNYLHIEYTNHPNGDYNITNTIIFNINTISRQVTTMISVTESNGRLMRRINRSRFEARQWPFDPTNDAYQGDCLYLPCSDRSVTLEYDCTCPLTYAMRNNDANGQSLDIALAYMQVFNEFMKLYEG